MILTRTVNSPPLAACVLARTQMLFKQYPDTLRQSWRTLDQELGRIQQELARFLPAGEAREVTEQIEALVLELDEEIRRIVQDPSATGRYRYDGQFFTSRCERVFHTAFDGMHLLQSLSAGTIRTFFIGRSTPAAITWLLEEIEKHRWTAKIRRMNWEEFGALGLLREEAIEAFHDLNRIQTPRPLSPEEEIFFRSLGMDS